MNWTLKVPELVLSSSTSCPHSNFRSWRFVWIYKISSFFNNHTHFFVDDSRPICSDTTGSPDQIAPQQCQSVYCSCTAVSGQNTV